MDDRCEYCGDKIPAGRRAAMPTTTTCVKCSRVFGYTEDALDLDGSDGEDMRRMVQNTREQS